MPKFRHIFLIFTYFSIIIGALSLSSCSNNPLEVDVSSVKVSMPLDRMEQDVFGKNVVSMVDRNKLLQSKYGQLYEIFMVDMLGEVHPQDPMASQQLESFTQHPDMIEIFDDIQKEFGDFSEYHQEIKIAFKHYKFYFPDSTLPRIITFYSNFNANVFPYENNIAIGLDMYLGTEHPLVKSLSLQYFPQYLKDKMSKEYLVADVVKAWLMNRFAKDISEGDNFLSTIITLGKIMYLVDAMLPEVADHIKFGCSESQILWCQSSEVNIWKTIVDEQVLYSKDKGLILQYVSEGPFTKGLPHESPSKVGVWLGWQMVRDYVAQNEVGVLDLLKQKNVKTILKSYSQGDRD